MEGHVEIHVVEDCKIQTTVSFDDLTFRNWILKKGAFAEYDVLYYCDKFLFCEDDYGYAMIERTDKLEIKFDAPVAQLKRAEDF